jgi:hypothetical protein
MVGKAAQFQFLIRVSGWSGYFVSRTGGDSQANVQKVYDGGALEPDLVAGRRTVNNVVVSRGWDPERDGPIYEQYDPLVGRWRTSVQITPTDENLAPTGATKNYPDCLLSRFGSPGANAQSDDPSTFDAEFTVGHTA